MLLFDGSCKYIESSVGARDCALKITRIIPNFTKKESMAKILVVDDETSIRRTLKDILEFEKHQVELASNGLEALEFARDDDYDVVLLDIKMPEMDGMEVLQKLMMI